MDVLLVNAPVNVFVEHAHLSPPLGLAYIGAVLLKENYSVSALDVNISANVWSELKKFLKETPPGILGISAYTETYLNGIKIARMAKEINPEIKIVMGGPHASISYNEVLQDKCIDVVVIGEGEITMLELAESIIRGDGGLADIKGIAYKEDGIVRVTEERLPISDLDELPFPANHLFPLESYALPVSILTSRGGCPFNCRFCAVNNIWKGKRRFRKPEKVAEEVLVMIRNCPQGTPVVFADDAFTLDRDCVLQICMIFNKLKMLFPLSWRCATRVDLVDEVILGQMRYAGCYSIQYGVESGSQKILDSIGKKIRLEKVREAVQKTIELGMEVTCSFMFPQPEDTEDTIKEQVDLMKELKDMGAFLSLAMTTPFPGTYYYEHADELGIKITSNNWGDYDCRHFLIATKHLSIEKQKKLLDNMVIQVGMKQASIEENLTP